MIQTTEQFAYGKKSLLDFDPKKVNIGFRFGTIYHGNFVSYEVVLKTDDRKLICKNLQNNKLYTVRNEFDISMLSVTIAHLLHAIHYTGLQGDEEFYILSPNE